MDTLPDIKIGDEVVRVIGHRHALVASHTYPGEWYVVEQDEAGTFHCTCKGAEVRKKCRHIDAVREWALGRLPATVIENASPEHRDQFSAIR